jgi:hypothetical protein
MDMILSFAKHFGPFGVPPSGGLPAVGSPRQPPEGGTTNPRANFFSKNHLTGGYFFISSYLDTSI